jgi:hypothetical protein
MIPSRHSGEGRNPFSILRKKAKWIPAFAGMTTLRLHIRMQSRYAFDGTRP